MPDTGPERKRESVLNRPVPRGGFRALSWATVAAFLSVALSEFRLGSLYHTALALGLALLVWSSSRRQEGGWGALALLLAVLVFGVFRAFTAFTLLRPA